MCVCCIAQNTINLPSSDCAVPPVTGLASKEVPRTVNTLTGSLDFTVEMALPKQRTKRKENGGKQKSALFTN